MDGIRYNACIQIKCLSLVLTHWKVLGDALVLLGCDGDSALHPATPIFWLSAVFCFRYKIWMLFKIFR